MRRIIQTGYENGCNTAVDSRRHCRSLRMVRLLCAGALGMSAPVVCGVVAEMRLLACTRNIDGNLGAGSILFEEAIGGFEQKALPAAHHLRNRRLHFRGSGEVQGAAFGVIGAVQMNVGAWNRVENRGKCKHTGIEGEIALHVRLDLLVLSGFQLIESPLPAQTQFADALLHLQACEFSLIQHEMTLDRNALAYRRLSR